MIRSNPRDRFIDVNKNIHARGFVTGQGREKQRGGGLRKAVGEGGELGGKEGSRSCGEMSAWFPPLALEVAALIAAVSAMVPLEVFFRFGASSVLARNPGRY